MSEKNLTCTSCGGIKETYSEIVYSQGSLVCTKCKELSLPSDRLAFDRDMALRTHGADLPLAGEEE